MQLPSDRCYVIAEIGANHNGDMALARRLIDAAAAAGADAAKFQSWDTGLFAESFYRDHPGVKVEVARHAVAPRDLGELAAYCRNRGIAFASTPFSAGEVEVLDALDVPFVKVASMDLNNDRLLRRVAATGRTVVLSTGFASMAEIGHALSTLEAEGNRDIVLLHCVSLYPPPSDDLVNLLNIDMLAETFGYPVGFSDHTLGIELTFAAIARGACIVEKHFTLDHAMPGWDHSVSAEPSELAQIVVAARRIPAALGMRRRVVSETERAQARVMRRSVVAARPIRAGETIVATDLTLRRPGTGIAPNDVDRLVGCVAVRNLETDDLLAWTDVVPSSAASSVPAPGTATAREAA